jgi:hypothetical protein
MIPAFLVSVESFFIAIMFFFAYNPKEYFIHGRFVRTTMVESGYLGLYKSYSGGFLGLKGLWEALIIWDMITNTLCAFRLLPSVFRRGNAGESRGKVGATLLGDMRK